MSPPQLFHGQLSGYNICIEAQQRPRSVHNMSPFLSDQQLWLQYTEYWSQWVPLSSFAFCETVSSTLQSFGSDESFRGKGTSVPNYISVIQVLRWTGWKSLCEAIYKPINLPLWTPTSWPWIGEVERFLEACRIAPCGENLSSLLRMQGCLLDARWNIMEYHESWRI